MSAIPVIAADSNTVDLTVTVSPYFSLTQNGSQTTTGVVQRASATSLEFTTPIALTFHNKWRCNRWINDEPGEYKATIIVTTTLE